MTPIARIELPEADPKFNMPYTPAIKVDAGKIVFCAGVTAGPIYHHHPHRDEDFADVPSDAEGQARRAMENLQTALRAAGADLGDVVMVTRFLTDLEGDQDAIGRVSREFFGDHRPTSTTVGVTRLAHESLRFEINAVAVVED